MKIIFSTFTFIIGGVFGSFSNVLIYRIPENISIVAPASFCPKCGAKIRFYDNIPIISYIILKGKCRSCGGKIPLRYFLVEVVMASLFLLSYIKFGFSINFLKSITFIFFAVNISTIDIQKMLIPDVLSLPGLVMGFLFALLSGKFLYFLTGGIIGAIIPGIFYIAGKIIKKDLMGEGDIIILAMIGLYTGWINVFIVLFIASLLGSIIGIPLKIKKKIKYLPFAPFLFASAILLIFYNFSTFLPYFLFKSYLK